MKIKYLGTAACEGIPALFCDCEACKNARINGGKDIRTRTQAVIDDKLLIDFPADSLWHMMTYGIDFGKFTSVLITHNHSDHLYAEDLGIRSKWLTKYAGRKPLNVYVGDDGKDKISHECAEMVKNGEIILHDVAPFIPFTVEGYTVIPIPASHSPESSPYIFVISDGVKTMLYGNDTGALKKETLEKLLALNVKFDLLSLDCTMGESPSYYGHLNAKEDVELANVLSANGKLNANCKKVVTHFSHNHYVSHKHFENLLGGEGFTVAYDGMELEF